MAQLVVKLTDTGTEDAQDYKNGDCVLIYDDSEPQKLLEQPPEFFRLFVNQPVDAVNYLLEPLTSTDGVGDTIIRKRYQLDFERLPRQLKDRLYATGHLRITDSVFSSIIVDKAV